MPPHVRRIYGEALGARYGLILAAGPEASDREATIAVGRSHADEALLAGNLDARAAAEAALEAAVEGQLVLASIESPGAMAAIARLRALRVDPFLIACGLRAVIAQRRVRRLCPECRTPAQATGSAAALLGFDNGTVVNVARGCRACEHTGYRGRIALFEAIRADPALRRLIGGGGDDSVIANQAFRETGDLGAAARALVRSGETSAEEAISLSRPALV